MTAAMTRARGPATVLDDQEVTRHLLILAEVERGQIWVVHQDEYRRVRLLGMEPRVTDPPLPDLTVEIINKFRMANLVAGAWPEALHLTVVGRRYRTNLRAETDALTSHAWLQTLSLAGTEAMMPWPDMRAPRVSTGPRATAPADAPPPDRAARSMLAGRLRANPGRWLSVYYGAAAPAYRLSMEITNGVGAFRCREEFHARVEPRGSDYVVYARATPVVRAPPAAAPVHR